MDEGGLFIVSLCMGWLENRMQAVFYLKKDDSG
jgi:hypothetical protein